MLRFYFLVISVCLLTACVYYPKASEQPIENCVLVMKHLTIDVYTELGDNIVNGMHSCNDESCLAVLALVVTIPVTTYVVSESIVLVNNTLYWLETQAVCENERPDYPPL